MSRDGSYSGFSDAQMRLSLIDALNGRMPKPAMCWEIINRWDASTAATAKRSPQDVEVERLAGRVAVLEAALRDVLAHPRWLSIGSIDNVVELSHLYRERYEALRALAAGDALPSPGAVLAGGDAVPPGDVGGGET